MNRSALLGLVTLVALGAVGCSTTRIASHSRSYNAPRRAPTYALAVTVHGGLQPTPAQWAAIQAKVAHELSLRGAVLVTDIALADRVIRIDFHPNPVDPENSGHLTVLGVRNNPYRSIASIGSSGPFATSFSYSRTFSHPSFWGSSNYYSGDYYTYIGPWENGYTSGSGTIITPPKITPTPQRPRPPHDRELCPPDALRPAPAYASNSSVRMAVAEPAGFANNSPATPTSSQPRRWTGERSAWRSDPSTRTDRVARSDGSRGDRSYSRGSNGSSRSSDSDYSSWRDRSYSRAESGYSGSSGGWWSGSRDSGSSHSSSSYESSRSYSSSSSSESMYTPSSTPSFSSSSSDSSSSSSYSSASSGATYNSSATEASSSDIAR